MCNSIFHNCLYYCKKQTLQATFKLLKNIISDVWFHSYIHRTQSLVGNNYQTPLNFPNESEKWIGCLNLWLQLEVTASGTFLPAVLAK